MKTLTASLILLAATTSLSGCASSNDPFELSQNGPTMKDLYKSHIAGEAPESSIQTEPKTEEILQAVRDSKVREVTAFSSRLPNPDLKMFIYPHRSKSDGVIIPGYEITLPMYDRVHYTVLGQ